MNPTLPSVTGRMEMTHAMRIEEPKRTEFVKSLEHLINYHSLEGGSDTPDFQLAEYLTGCLEQFNMTLQAREIWYGRTVMDRKRGDPHAQPLQQRNQKSAVREGRIPGITP